MDLYVQSQKGTKYSIGISRSWRRVSHVRCAMSGSVEKSLFTVSGSSSWRRLDRNRKLDVIWPALFSPLGMLCLHFPLSIRRTPLFRRIPPLFRWIRRNSVCLSSKIQAARWINRWLADHPSTDRNIRKHLIKIIIVASCRHKKENHCRVFTCPGTTIAL